MTAPELSIVVPVYDEGPAVIPILRAMEDTVRARHEILVVYDYDEDPTVTAVQDAGGILPTVRLLRNDLGRGVLNAMKAGLASATGNLIVISMADGSDDPADIDRMAVLGRSGADLVAASRYMHGGRQIGGPLVKRTLSRLAGLTLHWFAGVPVHDPTSNFKLYSRPFLDSVTIESRAGFELALELSVKATIAHCRLAEVPTTWRDRTSGGSHFKLRAWLPHYLRWYAIAFRAAVAHPTRVAHRR